MAELSESYNLYVLRPDLAKEWHPTRNGSLGPKDVTPESRQKVWWLCEHGHWWLASVRCRIRGMRCSRCLSTQTSADQRMVRVKPEFLKDWHPSRNKGFKASEVSVHHGAQIWWLCPQGHEWAATIRSRLKGKSCPSCSNAGSQPSSIADRRIDAATKKPAGSTPFAAPIRPPTLTDDHSSPFIGPEMRKAKRYLQTDTVIIERSYSEIIGYAQLINFSAGGMMLSSDFTIPLGELIKVRFNKPMYSRVPQALDGRVVWCREIEDSKDDAAHFSMGLCMA